MKGASDRLGFIPLMISCLLLLFASSSTGAHHDRDNPVAGPPSLSLQDAMDRVLEMEAKPEFAQIKENEALGKFFSASELLREVGFMICRGCYSVCLPRGQEVTR
jgi:hypothetical protein